VALQIRKGSGGVVYALVAAVNAIRTQLAAASNVFHADVTSTTVGDFTQLVAQAGIFAAPAATDLASLLRLCIEIAGRHALHLGDALAHRAADSANRLGIDPPVDLPSAQAFLNTAKAKFNAHLTQAGVHVNNDTTNAITAADATNLQTALDLANTYRAVYAAHIQSAPPGASIQLIDP
jgi:hypothetical protein